MSSLSLLCSHLPLTPNHSPTTLSLSTISLSSLNFDQLSGQVGEQHVEKMKTFVETYRSELDALDDLLDQSLASGVS